MANRGLIDASAQAGRGSSRGKLAVAAVVAVVALGLVFLLWLLTGESKPKAPAEPPDLAGAPEVGGPNDPKPLDSRPDLKFVTSLCRDQQGSIWVGAESDGAYRYAPQRGQWTRFSTDEGLGDCSIHALACDRKGRIWAGHLNHGVSVYNGERWRNYEIAAGLSRPGTLSGPLGERVFHIAVCPADGDVWIATNAGLTRYSESKDTWRYYGRLDGLPPSNPSSIAFDKAGNAYVATECDGVAIADAADGYKKWRIASGPELEPASATGAGLPSNYVNDILVDREGTVWAATCAGLAWSKDKGKTWEFLRGQEWAAKVRGRLDGPPPGWTAAASVSEDRLLQEDYCTCLAEDESGAIWVGHWTRGYEKLPAHFETQPEPALGKMSVMSLLALEDATIAGAFDQLVLNEGQALPPPAAAAEAPRPKLPSGAAAPDVKRLNELVAELGQTDIRAVDGAADAILLDDDWTSRGQWLGRTGRYWIVLAAMAMPDLTWGGGPERARVTALGVDPRANYGSVFWWITDRDTDKPEALEIPRPHLHLRILQDKGCWEQDRHDTYWNDGGHSTPESKEGPNLRCTVRIPAGRFRLSLYNYSHLRDFPIVIGAAGTNGAIEPLARARMCNFGQGVWKRFLVRGPSEVMIEMRRNHSHNTHLAAVALDSLDERPSPYFCTTEEWRAAQAEREKEAAGLQEAYRVPWSEPAAAPRPAAASVPEAISRLLADLDRASLLSPAFGARDSRRFWCEALRCLLAKENEAVFQSGRNDPAAACCFAIGQYERMEAFQRLAGLTPARDMELELRSDGKTDGNGQGARLIAAHVAAKKAAAATRRAAAPATNAATGPVGD